MRRLATAAVAALTAAALISASGTASADPRRNTWIDCQDGEISTGQLTIDHAEPGGILAVSGHVDPCSPPRSTDIFTVAAYYPNRAAAAMDADSGDDLVAWYAAYLDSEAFTFAARVHVDPDVQAICLVTGAHARALCYEVSVNATGDGQIGTPTVGATVPATDPRVQADVPCPPSRLSGPPSCATCW